MDPRTEFLAGAVERYLDNPGCNVPARQSAQRRLRWAMETVRATIHRTENGTTLCGEPETVRMPGWPVTCPKCLAICPFKLSAQV